MKNYLILLFLAYYSLTFSKNTDRVVGPALKEYERISSQITGLATKSIPSAEIENIVFKRDAATFNLTKGTLYLLPEIDQKVHALLFVGKGLVTVIPPTEIEMKQLSRFFEENIFPMEFKTLFLLFNDSTYEEITSTCNFAEDKPSTEIETSVKRSLKMIRNKNNDEFDFDILRNFLFNDRQQMFYAHFYKNISDSYFFKIDPYDFEEVSFGTKSIEREIFSSSGFRETILQFHTANEYQSKLLLSEEQKPTIDVLHYSLDNTFASDLSLLTKCTMRFNNNSDGRKWIPFLLFEKMNIDSICWTSGAKLEFIRLEESDIFWLFDDAGFSQGKTYSVDIYYHGEIISKSEGWYSLKTSVLWYPNSFEYRDKSTFDMKFSVPSKLTFIGCGSKVSSETVGDRNISQWKLATPGRNVSFMIGKFKEYGVTPDSTPPISVFVSDAHDASVRNNLAARGVLSGRNMDQQVSGDIENSIRFFQFVFGKSGVDQFNAVEIPDGHGEAFPGLVHLSWSTFQNTEYDGSDEIFRAHEVAHQWWGIGVSFKTYHDQWLSEAFSEYSGLWYMQTVVRNNEKFFDQMKNYKKLIMSNRKYLFGSGQEAGPIWLGYRTSSSNTSGDYDLIIYRKGAWVLHMLRNMAIDLKTMKEDAFQGMMKEFYQTYKGKSASTLDFQRITEKYFNIPMDWFFKQWIYNTEIPTYNIIYKLQEMDNGKFKVQCTVKQSNVPNDFQMYIPFMIDFGENRYARVRYLIKGPVTEFEFPILPIKPEEIKFNDLESVLCEIEDEDWD